MNWYDSSLLFVLELCVFDRFHPSLLEWYLRHVQSLTSLPLFREAAEVQGQGHVPPGPLQFQTTRNILYIAL